MDSKLISEVNPLRFSRCGELTSVSEFRVLIPTSGRSDSRIFGSFHVKWVRVSFRCGQEKTDDILSQMSNSVVTRYFVYIEMVVDTWFPLIRNTTYLNITTIGDETTLGHSQRSAFDVTGCKNKKRYYSRKGKNVLSNV